MKNEFKAKFLQHLVQKKEDKGFTLIELLVVIIIIGILSAIALPSFLNQANKAKQSEAKQYAGSMNRAQQAYYLENTAFTTTLSLLGLGIRQTTENYTYTVTGGDTAVSNNAMVLSTNSPLKSYAGQAYTGISTAGEKTTLAVLCETTNTGITTAPTAGTSCPTNFVTLTTK